MYWRDWPPEPKASFVHLELDRIGRACDSACRTAYTKIVSVFGLTAKILGYDIRLEWISIGRFTVFFGNIE